jgi:hypothetical protein
VEELNSVRDQIKALLAKPESKPVEDALKNLDQKLAGIQGQQGFGRGGNGNVQGLGPLRGALLGLFGSLQGADAPPTAQVTQAVQTVHAQAPGVVAAWQSAKLQDIANVNKQLQDNKLQPLKPKPAAPEEVELNEE